jgi:mannan endo-1,4-beta-mannosidase
MFGHQDDLAYGIGWWAQVDHSDVKAVCGDYPAVFDWDLGDINRQNNLDGVNFDNMIDWMRQINDFGGIITISMHLDNPVTDQNAWDNSEAVSSILISNRVIKVHTDSDNATKIIDLSHPVYHIVKVDTIKVVLPIDIP